ncbi:MAG: T9SS type A sorting domain-containing protein [Bacteroidales bacterium]|nr:T9SS type A sorting domain-containing protein [Bacteroidales bacterium]
MKKIFITICISLFALSLSAQIKSYTPTLTSPESGTINTMPITLMDWESIAGYPNLKYEIHISDQADFSNILFELETESSAIKSPVLKFNSEYFWRVRAIDDKDESEWSEVRSFVTLNEINVTAPIANALQVNPRPTYRWISYGNIDFEGISQIEIVICDSDDFDEDNPSYQENFIHKDSSAFSARVATVHNLNFNTVYYWRVRLYNDTNGEMADISSWSETKSFTTVQKNTPKSPSNNGTGIDPMVDLELTTNFTPPCVYIFQIDTDENFSSPNEYTSTSIKLTNYDTLLFNTEYFWRVKMTYGNSVSEWTDTWGFTTLNYPRQREPLDNASITNASNFTIDNIGGSSHYIFQVSASSSFPDEETYIATFDHIVGTRPTIYINNYVDFDPQENTTYYWRAKAFNIYNETEWCAARRFSYINVAGIDDYLTLETTIYPNPNSGNFKLEVNSSINNAVIRVYDLTGRIRYNETVNLIEGNAHNINVNLSKGLYILEINNNGIRTNKKFTVQ